MELFKREKKINTPKCKRKHIFNICISNVMRKSKAFRISIMWARPWINNIIRPGINICIVQWNLLASSICSSISASSCAVLLSSRIVSSRSARILFKSWLNQSINETLSHLDIFIRAWVSSIISPIHESVLIRGK